jgi:ABC-type Zn uptake system ZnuABC Zn-binding protein ZnuA
MKMIFNFSKIRSGVSIFLYLLVGICLTLTLNGCGQTDETGPEDRPLHVVATTSIVADIVDNIGGDAIQLTTLLPAGTDPHSYQPAPRDVALLSEADIIFLNGAGLEEFITPLLEGSSGKAEIVSLSDELDLLAVSEEDTHTEDTAHAGNDPHVWTDPNMIQQWIERIEAELSEADPGNSVLYTTNADNYRQALTELDGWIKDRVQSIPSTRRNLVTDHQTLAYFAKQYGFTQLGSIIPGISSLAEPSAQELARLEETLQQLDLAVIFVDIAANPTLVSRVAGDTGAKVASIYSGSLGEPGSQTDTYLKLMRYNVNAIVDALTSP